MEFPFAQRTSWSFNANPVVQQLNALRQKGIEVIDLTESNPTRCGFAYGGDQFLTPFNNPQNLVYDPDPAGSLHARQAIQAYYSKKGFVIELDRILLTASTSESYSFLFRLLLNPQDRVLLSQPSYPLFECLLDINDAGFDGYPLQQDHEWRIDLQRLANSFHSMTKAIVLVNPNNPTGSFLRKDEIEQLNKFCSKNHCAIICDEVFTDYAWERLGPSLIPSLVNNQDVLTFSLGGVSKSLALPQMKLGWIVLSGPQDMVKEARLRLEIVADAYLSVNTPSQNALARWFLAAENIQSQILDRVKGNYFYLKEALENQSECRLWPSLGGWYAVVQLPSLFSDEEWVSLFLNEGHVFVHPGYFFNFQEGSFIVISLLPQSDVFEEGVLKIVKELKQRKRNPYA